MNSKQIDFRNYIQPYIDEFSEKHQMIEILLNANNETKIQNLVLFYSILKYTKHDINFTILIPNEFDDLMIHFFDDLIKKYNNKSQLKNTIKFIKCNLGNDFISELHLIKPNLSKILYINHNIKIKRDLYKLFNVNFNKNQIIGIFENNFDLMLINLHNFKKHNIAYKYNFNKEFCSDPIENLKTILNESDILLFNEKLNKKIKHINTKTEYYHKRLIELKNDF